MCLQQETRRITEGSIIQFETYLRLREYSEGTTANYIRSVRTFAAWNRGAAVTRAQAISWKRSLIAQRAPSTVNAMLAGINKFFAFQSWSDCRLKPLRLQRRSFREPERQLEQEEYRRLVQTARAAGQHRLALLMETLCSTGIRVGETPYITVESARSGVVSISLKGKIRTILLPGKLRRRLLQYARESSIVSGAIFRTGRGTPLSRTQIWSEMKRLCRAAGVAATKVFPHNLRHLFARTYYRLCRDVVKLADILGHSSIDTTRIYLLSTGTEHLRQMERMGLLC